MITKDIKRQWKGDIVLLPGGEKISKAGRRKRRYSDVSDSRNGKYHKCTRRGERDGEAVSLLAERAQVQQHPAAQTPLKSSRVKAFAFVYKRCLLQHQIWWIGKS